MFGLVVLVFQLLALIFIGGFTRSTTAITDYQYFTKNCLLMLCFVLICAPYKKLTVHAIMVMIIGITVAFEMELLVGRFWQHLFSDFVTEFELTSSILVECSQAMLAVLLVSLDFIGIFQYWQMYLITAMTLTFGFAMNFGINIYGLQAFDGGGGFNIFLYSGAAAFVIWFLVVRGKYNVEIHDKEEYYTGGTLSLFGVVGATVYWPLFNASGGLITVQNTVLSSSATLENSGYTNTLMALALGVALAFLLNQRDGTLDYKDKLRTLLDCFLNAGIIIASFSDICLNPAAAMTASMLSTVLTLILYRYFYSLNFNKSENEGFNSAVKILKHYLRIIFRVLVPLLGLMFCTIVVRRRIESTPELLQDQWWRYSRKAGIEIAAFVLTLVFGLLFGLVTSLALNFFIRKKQQELQSSKIILSRKSVTDLNFFEDMNNQEIYPLYLLKQDQYIDEDSTARKILREEILSHIKEENAVTVRNQGKEGVGKISSNLDKYQTSLIIKNGNKSNIKSQKEEIRRHKSQANLSPKVPMPEFYENHQSKITVPEEKPMKKSKTQSRIMGISLASKILGNQTIKNEANKPIAELAQQNFISSSQKKPLLKDSEKPQIQVSYSNNRTSLERPKVERQLKFEEVQSEIEQENQHHLDDSRANDL